MSHCTPASCRPQIDRLAGHDIQVRLWHVVGGHPRAEVAGRGRRAARGGAESQGTQDAAAGGTGIGHGRPPTGRAATRIAACVERGCGRTAPWPAAHPRRPARTREDCGSRTRVTVTPPFHLLKIQSIPGSTIQGGGVPGPRMGRERPPRWLRRSRSWSAARAGRRRASPASHVGGMSYATRAGRDEWLAWINREPVAMRWSG